MNLLKKNLVFLYVFFSFSLFANSDENSSIFLLSNVIEIDKHLIETENGAVLLYQDGYMRADKLIVNKKTKVVEMFGNINLIKSGLYFFVGNYARISLKNDGHHIIESMFLYHKPKHVWLYADYSESFPEKYKLHNTFFSSCRAENPDWGLFISDGEYHIKKQQYDLKHVTLYAKKTPIFYFPYLSFSTKRERKTGLLVPVFSYSDKNGLYYSQSMYVVLDKSSDLEITPQYRSFRGKGAYFKYRFVDSPYSEGHIKLGYFKDNDEFQNEFQYAHKEHFGSEFYYKREALLENKYNEIDDGLLINLIYLNDIDYYLLESFNSSTDENSKIVESKLNYYNIYENELYFGIYNSYIIDLENTNTENETLQNLPTFHTHKFFNEISQYFSYSLDYNLRNFTRPIGSTAISHEASIPFLFSYNFLNNYLHLKIKNNFFASYIDFRNTDQFQDKSNLYLRNSQDIRLFTDLTRAYNTQLHVMNLGLLGTFQNFEDRRGFYNPEENFIDDNHECEFNQPCEFKRIDDVDEILGFEITQYLYNFTGQEMLYHRFKQSVEWDENKKTQLTDLENEVSISFLKYFNIYNNLVYSYQLENISKIGTALDIKNRDFQFNIFHTFQNNEQSSSNYLNTNLNFNLGDNYQFFGHYAYDIKNDTEKSHGVGWKMKKRCWNYEFYYKEERRPNLTVNGSSSEKETIVYFRVYLYPLGAFDYQIQ
jgi:LPS-assembly protein